MCTTGKETTSVCVWSSMHGTGAVEPGGAGGISRLRLKPCSKREELMGSMAGNVFGWSDCVADRTWVGIWASCSTSISNVSSVSWGTPTAGLTLKWRQRALMMMDKYGKFVIKQSDTLKAVVASQITPALHGPPGRGLT